MLQRELNLNCSEVGFGRSTKKEAELRAVNAADLFVKGQSSNLDCSPLNNLELTKLLEFYLLLHELSKSFRALRNQRIFQNFLKCLQNSNN